MKDFTKILKEISGKNEKVNVLAEMIKEEPLIAKICYYTMRHLGYKYGIKKMPEPIQNDRPFSWDYAFEVFDSLRNMNHSNESIEILGKLLGSADEDSRNIITRVILKNLDCGIKSANFNAALEKSGIGMKYEIRGYPCMLVSGSSEKLFNKMPWKFGVFSQEKCDGMRVNAVVKGESVEFFSRAGKPIYIISENIAKECRIARQVLGYDCVLDGELLVKRDGKILDRKTGNGILNKAVRGTITKEESDLIVQTVWDVIPLDVFEAGEGETLPYNKRFIEITKAVSPMFKNLKVVDSKIVYSREEAEEDFRAKVAEGKEGVIIKDPGNRWENSRVRNCIKMKAELDCDLKVVRWEEGTGKYKGMMGALVCESADGKVRVAIGSGFSDEERKAITEENSIGKIVTVLYNAKIESKGRDTYSLFLPRIVEFGRTDKTEADTLDKIAG